MSSRLEKLEQLNGCNPEKLTDEEIKEQVQAIRLKLSLPDWMDDMEVILKHSKEITAYLVENVGETRGLVVGKDD